MRLESWFITNPDERQQEILQIGIENSLIVKGAAGSGKTNMAIYKANQAENNSFVIIVYTIALKKMVKYGLKELQLDASRVVHEWSWINRGIDITGDVYCILDSNVDRGINKDILLLYYENNIEMFVDAAKYDEIIASKKILHYSISHPDEPLKVSVDFDDWVDNRFYYTFYRRRRWFKNIKVENFEFNPNSNDIELVPSGFLFRQKENIDHIIIDEGQDFSVEDYTNNFLPNLNKSIIIFGDSSQKLYPGRGTDIEELINTFDYPYKELPNTYRVPKSIAKLAQQITSDDVDLITNNKKNGGDSDFPTFNKPILKKCNSWEDELKYIIHTIEIEDLDDVGILLPNNAHVLKVYNYLMEHSIDIQVRFSIDLPENRNAGIFPMFRVVDTLDFTNNDLPCLLTYHSAKGTEFDNVFIPFANDDENFDRNSFYVAVTRSNLNLHITYSRQLTKHMNDVSKDNYTPI
jgi:hypothetical protein